MHGKFINYEKKKNKKIIKTCTVNFSNQSQPPSLSATITPTTTTTSPQQGKKKTTNPDPQSFSSTHTKQNHQITTKSTSTIAAQPNHNHHHSSLKLNQKTSNQLKKKKKKPEISPSRYPAKRPTQQPHTTTLATRTQRWSGGEGRRAPTVSALRPPTNRFGTEPNHDRRSWVLVFETEKD